MDSLFNHLQVLLKEFKDAGLANVFRFISFEQGDNFGPHRHKRIEINYIQKGGCTMTFGKNSEIFRENEMMIIFPLAEHAFIPNKSGVSLMQLEFMPDLFYVIAENDGHNYLFLRELFNSSQSYMKIINNIRITRAVQRIINELTDEKESYDLLVLMYYAELLLLISRQMLHPLLPISEGPLPQALAIIKSSFTQDISLKDVANKCGISERYLRKLFSTRLNTSCVEYINELRVNKAKELLKLTESSVKEIAYLCGFNSVEYFSRVFKQYVGVSAGSFQHNCKNNLLVC